MASSADGTRIWYGGGGRTILFVPTWNIVDARVVGHEVNALEEHATVITYDPRGAGASDRFSSSTRRVEGPMAFPSIRRTGRRSPSSAPAAA